MQMIFNQNNERYLPMNLDMKFKRVENRKKTYDIRNNIIYIIVGNKLIKENPIITNYLNSNINNINNINNQLCFNKQLEEQLLFNNSGHYKNSIYINNNNNYNIKIPYASINNNEDINNDYINISNNTIHINDSLIFEIKHLLELLGKIDYNIYNFAKGKFLSIIKNHKGSKIFQKYLKSGNSDEILHLIFIELSQNLEEIIIDHIKTIFVKIFFLFKSKRSYRFFERH